LGALSEAAWDDLIRNQIRALNLILSQIITAVMGIKTRETMKEGGIVKNGDLNPVLAYLANHMRSAKRMIEEMAANVAWRRQTSSETTDFSDKFLDRGNE
jgi:hypothetical protein